MPGSLIQDDSARAATYDRQGDGMRQELNKVAHVETTR
jgi:hypothetical protein